MTLDHDGRVLLNHYQSLGGPDAVREVGPVSAGDVAGRLEIEIDAARRVLAVRVRDLDGLRRPEALAKAVAEAYSAADAERGVA